MVQVVDDLGPLGRAIENRTYHVFDLVDLLAEFRVWNCLVALANLLDIGISTCEQGLCFGVKLRMLALRERSLLFLFERLAACLAVLLIGVVGKRQEVFAVAERRLLEKPVREHRLHVLAHAFGCIGGAGRDFVEVAEIAQANGVAVAFEAVYEVQAFNAHREQSAACDRRRSKNASHKN